MGGDVTVSLTFPALLKFYLNGTLVKLQDIPFKILKTTR